MNALASFCILGALSLISGNSGMEFAGMVGSLLFLTKTQQQNSTMTSLLILNRTFIKGVV